jgi:long-chain acyl-CoA synthetase
MTGTRLAEGYGLTETAPLVSFNPLDQPVRRGSIGVPVPGTDIALVDEDGRTRGPGQPRRIDRERPASDAWLLEAPGGYRESLAKRLVLYRRYRGDGWGWLSDIVDRKKDMVLVSGFNVYPNEVEDCLAQMDSVLEAAVIGIPDPRTGEAVRAYVVQNPDSAVQVTQEAVLAHCRKHLAGYKLPKSVIIRAELPKSPIGKILRKDLKAEMRAEFGQGG